MAPKITLGQKIWTDWETNSQFSPPIYKRHLDFNQNYISLIYSTGRDDHRYFDKKDIWFILFCGKDIQAILDVYLQKFGDKTYQLEDIEILKRDIDSVLVQYDKLLIFT